MTIRGVEPSVSVLWKQSRHAARYETVKEHVIHGNIAAVIAHPQDRDSSCPRRSDDRHGTVDRPVSMSSNWQLQRVYRDCVVLVPKVKAFSRFTTR